MRRVGVVEVTDTTLTTFGRVPWSFVQAENEGDESIEEWRDGHRRFWRSEDIDVIDETPVFLVCFKLIEAR